MKRDNAYRLLLLLFGLLILCLVTAGPHQLMSNLMAFGGICCHNLPHYLPAVALTAIIGVARTLIIVTLLTGFSLFVRRVWRLYGFLHVLTATSDATPLPLRLASLCTPLGLAGDVRVFATATPVAFCYGLFQPRICLSTGLVASLTDPELKAVLLHEDHHRRHYDPLRTLLADLVAQVLFFLPVVAEWRTRFCIARELAADRHAMHLAGRLPLAGALHKLLTSPSVFPVPAGVGGISGFNATTARLTQLLDDHSMTVPFSHRSLIHSSLLLSLACLVLQIARL